MPFASTKWIASAIAGLCGRGGLLVNEPVQLDRGFLPRDVEYVEPAGPIGEPGRGRPSAFGQVSFLVVVSGVVGNQLQRQQIDRTRHLVPGEDHGVALLTELTGG